MKSVLFVCTANICRSPMAAGLFSKKVKQLAPGKNEDWNISSAGVYAQNGIPASQNTLIVLRERGIDWGAHRSRAINRKIVEESHLILCMEQGHKEALRMAFPDFASRVYLLTEMIGQSRDIVDPIGKPIIEYEDTAREIENIFESSFERICFLSDGVRNEKDE